MHALELAQFRTVFVLLLLVQSTGAFMFQPFLPVYYRATPSTARKMTRSVMFWGLFICLATALLLPLITYYGFSFQLSVADGIWAAVFVISAHVVLPSAYKMIKQGQTIRMTVYSLSGTLILFPVFHFFFQQPLRPITSALAASALAQVIILILFLSTEYSQPNHA